MKHLFKTIFILSAAGSLTSKAQTWNPSSALGTMTISPITTKVGIGTSTPSVALTVLGVNAAPTPANYTGGALLIGGSTPATNISLQAGVYSSGGTYSWLQSRNVTSSTFYDLRLNPLGGNVGIGTNTPIQTFDISGRMHISEGVIQRGGSPITTTADLGLYSLLVGNYMRFVTNAAPIKFFTDGGTSPAGGTERFTIDENGFVTVANNLEVGPIAVRSAGIACQLWAANKTGIYLTTKHSADYGYGFKMDVDRNLTKALAVYNTATSKENFVVYGDGAVFARDVTVTLGTFNHPDYVFEKNYKLMPLTDLENYLSIHKHLPNVPSKAEVEINKGISLGEMSTKQLEKIEELTLYIIEINKKVEELNTMIATQQQQIDLFKNK